MKNQKIQTTINYYTNRLSDVRFVGQILFVLIVLMISWSGIKSIQSNYSLQKQITSLNQQNQIQKLKNSNLALQNQYYNSNQYLELSARQNFGLAAPGEKEIIVPQQVAMSYTVPLPKANTAVVNTAINHEPKYQVNLTSWFNFFFDRKKSTN